MEEEDVDGRGGAIGEVNEEERSEDGRKKDGSVAVVVT